MIRLLRGRVEALGPDWAVVETGGVGYQVFIPPSVLASLGPLGSQVQLHTHLIARDEGLSLYGFTTGQGLHLFELLLGVSGVGPRLALSILSGIAPDTLALAIATEDAGVLSSVSGVGRRTAARIILELKEKMAVEWEVASPTTDGAARGDVIGALQALGYSPTEARQAAVSLPQDPSLSLEEQVRQALQRLASG